MGHTDSACILHVIISGFVVSEGVPQHCSNSMMTQAMTHSFTHGGHMVMCDKSLGRGT